MCLFLFFLLFSAGLSFPCLPPLSALLSSITLNPNYPRVSQLCQTAPFLTCSSSFLCLYLHYTSSSVLPVCWILLGLFAVYWYRLGKIKPWNWNKHLSGRVWSWQRVRMCYWQSFSFWRGQTGPVGLLMRICVQEITFKCTWGGRCGNWQDLCWAQRSKTVAPCLNVISIVFI